MIQESCRALLTKGPHIKQMPMMQKYLDILPTCLMEGSDTHWDKTGDTLDWLPQDFQEKQIRHYFLPWN